MTLIVGCTLLVPRVWLCKSCHSRPSPGSGSYPPAGGWASLADRRYFRGLEDSRLASALPPYISAFRDAQSTCTK
ncbi:hypothetical protein V8F33_002591 [Rhypophila sp. PSN 637]